ncbi:endonuclease/exonuclease/phosphatase family protein [uncultured Pluralibacter sp.]|uniref:endonuclease/exonuclease/phosphatase family protein n=1 Tax=uncultured Pluralibacter sp. TaxID=1490864 RepID=UPI00260FEE81|nr:endonuclease/exonuclease/phosphatase family protein [uncultured Pluralibacter sp.]
MRKNEFLFIAIPLLFNVTGARSAEPAEIKVLSFNIWQEGTSIRSGYQAIVDRIADVDPDIVTLVEVRNYKDDFLKRLANDLDKRGLHYHYASTFAKYGKKQTADLNHKGTDDTGILTKYPITAYDSAKKSTRAELDINGRSAVVYAVHLDYQKLAQYEPRGYSGDCCAYSANPNIIIDEKKMLAYNAQSKRPAQIRAVLEDADAFRKQKDIVIVAGDFNEPSHLDWTENTRNQYGHNGAVINWTTSSLMTTAGYTDSFRTLHPNEVLNPGFTWLANNTERLNPDIKDPGIDERDRIDFIYVNDNSGLKILSSKTYGPAGEVTGGVRDSGEIESEKISVPAGKIWPSDHLAVLTTFGLTD